MDTLGKTFSRSLSCIFPCPCQPGFKDPLSHSIKDFSHEEESLFGYFSLIVLGTRLLITTKHVVSVHVSLLNLDLWDWLCFSISLLCSWHTPSSEEWGGPILCLLHVLGQRRLRP